MMPSEWQCIVLASADTDDQFRKAGYTWPRNLIPVGDGTVIEHAIDSYTKGSCSTFVMVRTVEIREFSVDLFLESQHLSVSLIPVSRPTKGALCTALLAVDDIDLDLPVVIAPSDSQIRNGINKFIHEFIDENAIIGVLTFNSTHPRYSYVKQNRVGAVIQIEEKLPVSNMASTGVVYFRSGRDFLKFATWALLNNQIVQGRFFVSGAIRAAIALGFEPVTKVIDSSIFRSLSTPEDIAKWTKNENW